VRPGDRPKELTTLLQEVNVGGGLRKRENVQTGLVKLVLTLVEVIRQVMEKQALRRVDAGDLTVDEVERLGVAFIEIRRELRAICRQFGIDPSDLRTELGQIVRTGDRKLDGASLADVLDRLMYRGAVVAGKVRISVSDIDLLGLDLYAMLYPVYKNKQSPRRAS
jgi:gas vesicle protein GvpK/gas vesicle protein GvpA/GvpJ/GvpM family